MSTAEYGDHDWRGRVVVLETVVWGPNRDNGLRGDVRTLEDKMEKIDEKVDGVIATISTEKIEQLSDRLQRIDSWALAIIASLIVVGGGVIAAILSAH